MLCARVHVCACGVHARVCVLSICVCVFCVLWRFCVVIIVIAEEVSIGTLSSAYFSCFINGWLYNYIVRSAYFS